MWFSAGSLSHSELDALVEESLLMSRFDHRNVMKLIGVSIENNNTLYIVMPFMTHGSLLSYLRSHRAELTIDNDDDPDLVKKGIFQRKLYLGMLTHGIVDAYFIGRRKLCSLMSPNPM